MKSECAIEHHRGSEKQSGGSNQQDKALGNVGFKGHIHPFTGLLLSDSNPAKK
jgi:hypothetical protein